MATAVIIDNSNRVISSANAYDYGIINISDLSYKASVSSVLPFRISFTNIGIEGYSANNPAPIGIAIIGYNNYIL